MLNTDRYIQSGILESYALGELTEPEAHEVEKKCRNHSEILSALHQIQDGLNLYLESKSQFPPQSLRSKIVSCCASHADFPVLNDKFRLKQFISISEESHVNDWAKLIQSIPPPDHFEQMHLHELYRDKKAMLAVLWVNDNLPEEVHETVYESVLVIEGKCKGRIGADLVDLQKGDFWKIPLNISHAIEVEKGQRVTLILMREVA